MIFEEEYFRAGGPARGPERHLLVGTHDVRLRHRRAEGALLAADGALGDEIWAQGWSEPDAGSDLAGIRTRARRVDGGWVLDGHKTWCSRAVFADWIVVLCRTDSEASRHRGLSYLLTPLDAPGASRCTRSRSPTATRASREVFFDEVFVPDDGVLGVVNDGWAVAMATAGSERSLSLRSPGRFLATADHLVRAWRSAGPQVDPSLDDAVVRGWLDADAYRLHTFATVTGVVDGQGIGPEASANKVFWSDLDLHLHETALALLGERAELTVAAPDAVDDGRWLDGWLFSLAGPIYAGTNEIQRDAIADRVLGLPRSR